MYPEPLTLNSEYVRGYNPRHPAARESVTLVRPIEPLTPSTRVLQIIPLIFEVVNDNRSVRRIFFL